MSGLISNLFSKRFFLLGSLRAEAAAVCYHTQFTNNILRGVKESSILSFKFLVLFNTNGVLPAYTYVYCFHAVPPKKPEKDTESFRLELHMAVGYVGA